MYVSVFSVVLLFCFVYSFFFFFKQKTAYEMRISDWSSDVCSSDLTLGVAMDTALMGLAELSALRLQHDRNSSLSLNSYRNAELRRQIGRASCRERVCQYV